MKNGKTIKNFILLSLTIVCCMAIGTGGASINAEAKPAFYAESGTIHNIVLFVNFADTQSFADESYLEKTDKMYNTSDISLKKYISAVSKNKLQVETHFLKDKNLNSDVTVAKKREYYLPRYRYDTAKNVYIEINPEGYDNRYYLNGSVTAPSTQGAKKCVDGFYREQTLLREAISLVDGSEMNYNLDVNGDGYLDGINFILNTDAVSSDYDELIWPHMSSLYNYGNSVKNSFYIPKTNSYDFSLLNKCTLAGTEVKDYDLLSYGYIERTKLTGSYSGLNNVGVICHEFMHTLGIMDYYAYDGDTVESVGEFDVMAATTSIPQYPLSYVRQKAGWLKDGEDILPIYKDGEYSLKPVTESGNVKAYKIVLDDYFSTGEYFMLEVRSSTNTNGKFDSMISDTGLIVYRVNEQNAFYNQSKKLGAYDYGNMYGAEEVYIMRCGNNEKINSRSYSYAIYNGNLISDGLDVYDKSTLGSGDLSLTVDTVKNLGLMKKSTLISYGDGTNSGIKISDITVNDGGEVSFYVDLPDETNKNEFLQPQLKKHYDYTDKIIFNPIGESDVCHIAVVEYNEKTIDKAKAGTLYTAGQIINGKIDGVILKDETPAAFKEYKLDDIKERAIVLVVMGDGENAKVYYAGELNAPAAQKGFWDFLKSGCKR